MTAIAVIMGVLKDIRRRMSKGRRLAPTTTISSHPNHRMHRGILNMLVSLSDSSSHSESCYINRAFSDKKLAPGARAAGGEGDFP